MGPTAWGKSLGKNVRGLSFVTACRYSEAYDDEQADRPRRQHSSAAVLMTIVICHQFVSKQ